MNSRRLIASPQARRRHRAPQTSALIGAETGVTTGDEVLADVRFGSCVTNIAGPNGGAQLYER